MKVQRAPKWYEVVSSLIYFLDAPVCVARNLYSFSKQNNFRSEHRAAVLINSKEIIEKGALTPGFDVYINTFILNPTAALINNELYRNGIKAEWIFDATKSDLETVLQDDYFQSFVNIGMGSRSEWEAHDGIITTDDIKEIYGDRPKKKGIWIQHTGGRDNGLPLGYHVMENPEQNCFFYENALDGFAMRYFGLPKNTLSSIKVNA